MIGQLLERDGELEVLEAGLAAAAGGQGSVALIYGEPGIGKTSLIRTFLRRARPQARVLNGACDDLSTPRTLGPLRDAVARQEGPLAAALAGVNREDVLDAMVAELSRPVDSGKPTVVVVEDVHWADDATLDVLRYLARRIEDLPALLLISYRDEEVSRDHPAHRLIGSLAGHHVYRLGLQRLSRAGVAQLAGASAGSSSPLFQLTAGNPFYLTEVLAAGRQAIPTTVVDAVLARVHRLVPATQVALEQLAVVPTRVELPLARALLGDLGVLAEAERRGILEVRPDAIAFRHELARRAVESSMPATERMQLNGNVLAALLSQERPDLPRVIHHAAAAGDDAVVVEHAPRAAAQAAAAGAFTQEIRFRQEVLARPQMVDSRTRAATLQAMTGSLFVSGRMDEALAAGRAAVDEWEQLGELGHVGETLCVIGPIYWVTTRSDEALTACERSVNLLRADGQSPRLVFALVYFGLLLTATGRLEPLPPIADEALSMAYEVGAPDLIAIAHTLHGRSRLLGGDTAGVQEIRQGLSATIASGNQVFAIMGYVLLVQDLWDLGEFDEVATLVEEALAWARVREVDFYAEHLIAHQIRLRALHGEWADAEAGLRELVGARGGAEPGSLRYSLPALAVLATRRGAPDAAELLNWSLDFAERAGGYYDIVPAAFAQIEAAWLADRPDSANGAIQRILDFDGRGLQAGHRGQLERWLSRLGRPATDFTDCPEVFRAGLNGDWSTAAKLWDMVGAPYEQALELLDSGATEPTLAALRILDSLGCPPGVQLARRRLRDLGVTQIPRGPKAATKANPAGLTERQVEILAMLSAGNTNAEIAARLVVSVRTVDHHVSAVLQKLGLTNRRQAAAAAMKLGLIE